MEILISWLILSALVGWWAHSKGRSVVGYMLLSLLFSPLVGAIVLMIRGSGADSNAGHSRRCPFCAEAIRPEAILCPHCRSDLTTEKARSLGTGSAQPVGAQSYRCGECRGEYTSYLALNSHLEISGHDRARAIALPAGQ